jgi:hypothetical protein
MSGESTLRRLKGESSYSVKACKFDGNHQAAPTDSGGGGNGQTTWSPTESWKFFTQF